jgi:hypothetical protein
MEIQAFHALRIGLCPKVDEGHLTVEQATKIFEAMRAALVKKKRVRKVGERKGGGEEFINLQDGEEKY